MTQSFLSFKHFTFIGEKYNYNPPPTTYGQPSALFINEDVIYTKEGTTQGDPLAMSMYVLGILPSIKKLNGAAKQVWFADDSTAGGKLEQIRLW